MRPVVATDGSSVVGLTDCYLRNSSVMPVYNIGLSLF